MLEDVDISVPVTLQYHPDAVKPDEYPGWVGLGWNLKAGGSIVRITKGKHDEIGGGYYDSHINTNPNSLLNDFNWNLITDPISSPIDFLPDEEDFEDYEPDEFIFNFAGYSGKFYFNHLGEWVFTTNSGEHFEMSTLDSPTDDFNVLGSEFGTSILNGGGHGFTSFTITTNNGTKYTFGGSSNSVEYTRNETDVDGNQLIPTAWHLTSIESINGKGKQTAHIQFSLTLEHYGPENGLGYKGLTSSYHTQLAHELQHAKDYFEGNNFSYIFNPDKPYFESEYGGVTSYSGNYIPGSELSAVETENKVREEMGMIGLRTHYAGINVFNKEISKTMRNFGKGIKGYYPVDSRNAPKWGSFAKNNKTVTPIMGFFNLGVKESYLPINSYESTINRYGHDFRLRRIDLGINILQKKQ